MLKRALLGNSVRSSDGYTVTLLSRTSIRYTQGGRRAFVSAEMLAAPRRWAIFAADIREGRPNGPQVEPAFDRELIRRRVVEALRFAGYEVDIA